jgi:hypothetical protein
VKTAQMKVNLFVLFGFAAMIAFGVNPLCTEFSINIKQEMSQDLQNRPAQL